jgi:FAD synthetase
MKKKRVVATGVFDLLHIGHLFYLEESKKLGDELVVIVANDSTVRRKKHNPIMPQEVRRKLVESLKPVDRAVIGYQDDMFRIIKEIRPDVITIGYDQFLDGSLEEELKKNGCNAEIVRLAKYEEFDLNGTRKIINRIAERISGKDFSVIQK